VACGTAIREVFKSSRTRWAYGFGSYRAPREAGPNMGAGDMAHYNVIYLHPCNKRRQRVPGMRRIHSLRQIHTVN